MRSLQSETSTGVVSRTGRTARHDGLHFVESFSQLFSQLFSQR